MKLLHSKKCFYLPCIEVNHRFSMRGDRNPETWKKNKNKQKWEKLFSWRSQILLHDYAYWKEKWGFDILNPNMEEVKARYQGTEIVWNYDENLKSISRIL